MTISRTTFKTSLLRLVAAFRRTPAPTLAQAALLSRQPSRSRCFTIEH